MVGGIPPIAKIYEAFSAIGDSRVEMHDAFAYVSSSNNRKKYVINWNGDTYSANDNVSYYRGYMRYPVIAGLMIKEN